MGRNDTCEKAFMADNTIFADVVNGVIVADFMSCHGAALMSCR